MPSLNAGQSLLLNQRLWTLRAVRHLPNRNLQLDAIGASAAAQGMTRRLTAVQYGPHLFVAQRRGGYWQAHLESDWVDGDTGPVLHCRPASALDVLNIHTQYPAVGRLKNRLSWSFSRSALHAHCPRAYYYHYYAAWEGWQADAPAPVRRAYLLKNLTDIPRWRGTLVHDLLKFALSRLKTGAQVPRNRLIQQLHRRAKTDVAASKSGRYRQQPNKITGFQEHYYQTGVPDAAWAQAVAQAEQLADVFLQSPLYARLLGRPRESFLNIEELQSFEIAGVTVWVQMDLARREDNRIILYDWKTGQIDESAVRRQLGVYALFMQAEHPAWVVQPVRGVVFALSENRTLEFEFDGEALRKIRAGVEADIARLRGLLGKPAQNLAELRRFPMIENGEACRVCRFRELCGRN
ncbi:MAG: Dna2/Cas4 domain-containing protein [Chloroflexi bacterium]|nr:MAG: Dna2/Cas4 domain-containing protein [Chloroflexota bacterium]